MTKQSRANKKNVIASYNQTRGFEKLEDKYILMIVVTSWLACGFEPSRSALSVTTSDPPVISRRFLGVSND